MKPDKARILKARIDARVEREQREYHEDLLALRKTRCSTRCGAWPTVELTGGHQESRAESCFGTPLGAGSMAKCSKLCKINKAPHGK